MYFEGTIKATKMDEKGIDKEVKESFIIENAELFGEAEQKLLELYNGECEVVAIKRANILEIVNQPSEDSKIFKAKLITTFVDDKGKEKEKAYYVLLFAKNIENANSIMREYVKSGLQDLEIKSISETKYLEVLN